MQPSSLSPTAEAGEPSPSAPVLRRRSLILFCVLLAVYLANLREMGNSDTFGTTNLTLALVRGDGPFLDRFFSPDSTPESLPYYAALKRGRVVSRYPVAPAVLALPVAAPLTWGMDLLEPGWDNDPEVREEKFSRVAKAATAVLAALTGVVLFHLLRLLGIGTLAWPTALAVSLGSPLWTVASQTLWQHGPAAFTLSLALLLLIPAQASPGRLCLAGLATALLVCCRSFDVIFAAALFGWVIGHYRSAALWFLPFPLLLGAALVAYNHWFFGTLVGDQAELEAIHGHHRGVAGFWATDLREGAAGTLLSPNRGLFIFVPWIPLTLCTLPAMARQLRRWPLLCVTLAALVPYGLLLSKFSGWWAGFSFGPRFWTDTMPLFAILLGFALTWARTRCRPFLLGFLLTILAAVGIQAIGAFCYPSSWNYSPASVDVHHERLWDWRDTELARCLKEGLYWSPTPRLPPPSNGRDEKR